MQEGLWCVAEGACQVCKVKGKIVGVQTFKALCSQKSMWRRDEVLPHVLDAIQVFVELDDSETLKNTKINEVSKEFTAHISHRAALEEDEKLAQMGNDAGAFADSLSLKGEAFP